MRKLIFIICILIATLSQAQTNISLPECFKALEQNYPLINKINLLDESQAIDDENLAKNFLPQLNVNGQISYQSDVTTLPIELPNICISSM